MGPGPFDADLLDRARRLLDRCRQEGIQLVTAESCTGGLIAACLTEIPGASDVVDRGYVTYSNAAKSALLDVPPSLIEKHGAVSAEVAAAMAAGSLRRAGADIALAVTGVAGPGGGTSAKPVGLVFIACATNGGTKVARHLFPGDRSAIRHASVGEALNLALTSLSS